jgi:hypothetical protein
VQSVNFHPSVFEVREAKLRHFSETADAVTHISFHRRLSGAVVSGITATLEGRLPFSADFPLLPETKTDLEFSISVFVATESVFVFKKLKTDIFFPSLRSFIRNFAT